MVCNFFGNLGENVPSDIGVQMNTDNAQYGLLKTNIAEIIIICSKNIVHYYIA